jgi:hypothetical protein
MKFNISINEGSKFKIGDEVIFMLDVSKTSNKLTKGNVYLITDIKDGGKYIEIKNNRGEFHFVAPDWIEKKD